MLESHVNGKGRILYPPDRGCHSAARKHEWVPVQRQASRSSKQSTELTTGPPFRLPRRAKSTPILARTSTPTAAPNSRDRHHPAAGLSLPSIKPNPAKETSSAERKQPWPTGTASLSGWQSSCPSASPRGSFRQRGRIKCTSSAIHQLSTRDTNARASP